MKQIKRKKILAVAAVLTVSADDGKLGWMRRRGECTSFWTFQQERKIFPVKN